MTSFPSGGLLELDVMSSNRFERFGSFDRSPRFLLKYEMMKFTDGLVSVMVSRIKVAGTECCKSYFNSSLFCSKSYKHRRFLLSLVKGNG